MALDLAIRAAENDDLSRVLDLYIHLHANDQPLSKDDARKIWQQMLNSDGICILLGEIGDQAVTTCTLVVIPNLTRGGRAYAVIENVVTHPDFRKQGAGMAILKDAVRRARERNCYKVVLTTGSKRESTLAFYEKAGFQRNSRTAFEVRFS